MMFFSSYHTGRSSSEREGFTLPEVLIATLVLMLVIFSSTSLLVGVMRSNNENIRTLQAFSLAQEGLEGVRNIRDSDWLLGGRYDGTLGNSHVPVWGAAFPSGGIAFYTIDLGIVERTPGLSANADSLRGNTPWVLTQITEEDTQGFQEDTQLQIFTDERTGEVRYGHEFPLGPLGEPSLYHRFVAVEDVSENPDHLSKYRVTSVVRWEEGTREKEVRLDAVLTDWNQGQL